MHQSLPIISIAPLRSISRDGLGIPDLSQVVKQLRQACREYGFFYITDHGIDQDLQQRLEDLSRRFFAQDPDVKLRIPMSQGGRAWRGYFPVRGELTSGKPDRKEGLYFGSELEERDPRVQAQIPLHGRNLFPDSLPELKATVLQYLEAMTELGHDLMEGIALSLDLDPNYFEHRYIQDPLILFRIFNYPASDESSPDWGVGEHTDYGLLTILKQDVVGGLQVYSQGQWIPADPVPNSFVCNIGDMLERITGGYYRSTPHRVKNTSTVDRLSFPFFFDPNFNSKVEPIAGIPISDNWQQRWDASSVHLFEGSYGDYVLHKVGKVFPELRQKALDLPEIS